MSAPMNAPDVRAEVRWELLRAYARYRDFMRRMVAEGHFTAAQVEFLPLFGAGMEWKADEDDLLLAVRECAAMGEVEAPPITDRTVRAIYGAVVRITDVGYDRVQAHDLVSGEVQP